MFASRTLRATLPTQQSPANIQSIKTHGQMKQVTFIMSAILSWETLEPDIHVEAK